MLSVLNYRARVLLFSIGSLLMVLAASPAHAANIAVHWSGYAGDAAQANPVTGTDGVVPNSNWTNVLANWYSLGSGNNTNLVDSNGTATTASVTCVTAGGTQASGTYWWYYYGSPANPTEPLLTAPGGGDGSGTGNHAIPTVISGIPYSTYNLIFYVNQLSGGTFHAWLDSNPASPSDKNATNPATTYYYTATGTGTNSFVPITNTNSSLAPAGNYVEIDGLTGANQTLWVDGADNLGSGGIQIVDASPTPEPTSLALMGLSGGLLLARRRRR